METQLQEHLVLLCFAYGCVWCVRPHMFVQVKKLVEA